MTASVFFSSAVANPDAYTKFYTDLQMYTSNSGIDPERFLRNGCSWEASTKENKWQGRNITRWKNDEYDATYKAAVIELDPVKRAALLIKLNDLIINNQVEIPVVARRGAVASNLWPRSAAGTTTPSTSPTGTGRVIIPSSERQRRTWRCRDRTRFPCVTAISEVLLLCSGRQIIPPRRAVARRRDHALAKRSSCSSAMGSGVPSGMAQLTRSGRDSAPRPP